jgi:hypothetical protein
MLAACSALKQSHVVSLWKTVADFFEQHLMKFMTVNQAKNSLDMDLSASQTVLLFPFRHFPSVESKQAWNQWNTLYNQVTSRIHLVLESILRS